MQECGWEEQVWTGIVEDSWNAVSIYSECCHLAGCFPWSICEKRLIDEYRQLGEDRESGGSLPRCRMNLRGKRPQLPYRGECATGSIFGPRNKNAQPVTQLTESVRKGCSSFSRKWAGGRKTMTTSSFQEWSKWLSYISKYKIGWKASTVTLVREAVGINIRTHDVHSYKPSVCCWMSCLPCPRVKIWMSLGTTVLSFHLLLEHGLLTNSSYSLSTPLYGGN